MALPFAEGDQTYSYYKHRYSKHINQQNYFLHLNLFYLSWESSAKIMLTIWRFNLLFQTLTIAYFLSVRQSPKGQNVLTNSSQCKNEWKITLVLFELKAFLRLDGIEFILILDLMKWTILFLLGNASERFLTSN